MAPVMPPIPTTPDAATLLPAADLRSLAAQLRELADDARRRAGDNPPEDSADLAEAETLDMTLNLITVAVHGAAKRIGDLARSDTPDGELLVAVRRHDPDAKAALVERIAHRQTDIAPVPAP